MRKVNLIKVFVATVVLIVGLLGFSFTPRSEMQTLKTTETPSKSIKEKEEIAGYKKWTKVNAEPHIVRSDLAGLCRAPTKRDFDGEIHKNKYINVFVNSIGRDEMLTRKNPVFPVGTVVVKEKLPSPDSQSPELLTVMIKREKDFNAEVGDWEFMTFNGEGTEITARGKLESCQSCHAVYKESDFITRKYLPANIMQNLK